MSYVPIYIEPEQYSTPEGAVFAKMSADNMLIMVNSLFEMSKCGNRTPQCCEIYFTPDEFFKFFDSCEKADGRLLNDIDYKCVDIQFTPDNNFEKTLEVTYGIALNHRSVGNMQKIKLVIPSDILLTMKLRATSFIDNDEIWDYAMNNLIVY
jgi:hypothetical protein